MSAAIQITNQQSLAGADNFSGDFLSQNNVNEPMDIGIVLPRYAHPLTQAEEIALSTEIDVLVISDCLGIDIIPIYCGLVIILFCHKD